MYSGGVLEGLTISGGTAVISAAVPAGQAVTFAGSGGDLALYGVSGASFAATLSGFAKGDAPAEAGVAGALPRTPPRLRPGPSRGQGPCTP